MVVKGSCSFNGELLGPLDCAVVEADTDYSFTSGNDGVTFIVTRQAIAEYSEPAK